MKILLAIALLTLGSCQIMNPRADLQQLGNSKWTLVQIAHKPVSLGENAYIQFDEKDQEIKGKAGCNNFTGGYERLRNAISFEELATTKMFCENGMEDELAILTSLKSVKRFEIKADQLYLYSSDQLVLTYKR